MIMGLIEWVSSFLMSTKNKKCMLLCSYSTIMGQYQWVTGKWQWPITHRPKSVSASPTFGPVVSLRLHFMWWCEVLKERFSPECSGRELRSLSSSYTGNISFIRRANGTSRRMRQQIFVISFVSYHKVFAQTVLWQANSDSSCLPVGLPDIV